MTVEWPHGTASIRGTIDRAVRSLWRQYDMLRFYSADVRWSSPVGVNEEGRFEIRGIPAGDYTLTVNRFRSGGFVPLTLKEVHLAEGEAKTFDIRQAEIPQSEL